MTKTTNYSLPQWEATDALKRGDFNEAMAAIDMGLGARAAQQLAAFRLEEEFAAMGDTLTESANRLLNPLTSAEMADTLTGADWDAEKHVFIGYGPTVERDFLQECCTNFTRFSTSTTYNANAATALYEFTAPISGTILDFDLHYYMFFGTNTSLSGTSMTFTAEELQGDTYVAVYTKSGISCDLSGTTFIQGSVTIPVEAPLKKGFTYRLTLHLDSGEGVLGNMGFTSNKDTNDSGFTFLSHCTTTGAHTHAVTARGKVTHAVAVLRYWDETGTGSVSASIDGAPMEESSRTTAVGESAAEHEVWFFGSGAYGENPTLTITLNCDMTDRTGLLKYGVLLM